MKKINKRFKKLKLRVEKLEKILEQPQVENITENTHVTIDPEITSRIANNFTRPGKATAMINKFKVLYTYLNDHDCITAKEGSALWDVIYSRARLILEQLCEYGILTKIYNDTSKIIYTKNY